MNRLIVVLLFLIGCGTDTLRPINAESIVNVTPSEASENEPTQIKLNIIETMIPDNYCELDFYILTCEESFAVVAKGNGCLKIIEILYEQEASEVCDKR